MAESEAELTEIHASKILNMIQRKEPVIYDKVVIKGEFDLQLLGTLPVEIDTPIRITNSQFEERVHFGKIFNNDIDFEHTLFAKGAGFSARFSKRANFRNATFKEDAFFRRARFEHCADFNGSVFGYANFEEAKFCWIARFREVTINGSAIFNNAVFDDNTDFSGATFTKNPIFPSDHVDFENVTFSKKIEFNNVTFAGNVYFNGASFIAFARFVNATFNNKADFDLATFGSYADFKNAAFNDNANFYNVTFRGYLNFRGAIVGDDLTFRNAVFSKPKSQEDACRRAKNIFAKAGNRDEEDYHFYREMDAKRIQKGIRGNSGLGFKYLFFGTDKLFGWKFFWYDVIEYYLIQVIFGYGVHPRRVIVSWFSIVIIFTLVYWAIDGTKGGLLGTLNYIEGSFATAIAPGYIAVVINSTIHTPIYHAMAIFETIIGTFLWAGFIATFAKRYMR